MDAQIRYFIEIDEEGYPMFDGLRVQDEALTRALLASIKRRDSGEIRSALVAECEGELCFVNAFSDPLVAQLVDGVNESSSEWIFPGDLRVVVPHADIKIDEWNRLHAWLGPDRIPAVMSRKAQSALLHQIDLKRFRPQPWLAADDAVDTERFWTEVYEQQKDGWELKGPTPVLEHHFKSVEAYLGQKLLVPGAGRGHDAEFLSSQSFDVTALDFSPVAETEFHRLYPKSKVRFAREDVFAHFKTHPHHYDGIFEHTIFCAIDPRQRRDYIAGLRSALKAKGLWFGIFFIKNSPGGPPFSLTQWELRELVSDHFEILQWTVTRASHPARLGKELWAVLKNRD